MTRIYLDVHDGVRVDKTPDSRLAKKADFDRLLLKMNDNLVRLTRLAIKAREQRGLHAGGMQVQLETLAEMRSETIANA